MKTGRHSLLLALALATPAFAATAQRGLSVTRLDDRLNSASIQASSAAASVSAAEPVVWQNFFSKSDLTWRLVRGSTAVHNGDLMVKGDGSTPVLFSPAGQAIDWALYGAVEIRMSAQGGHEIKIKIGDFEGKQKLGPAGQYNIYRFEINVDAPKGGRVLGLMPTDSLTDPVAIRSIKLVPKAANFTKPAGRENLGKADEYRSAVYVRSPAALSFHVPVPSKARLHFGMGTMTGAPVTFRVSVGRAPPLYSKTITDASAWVDGDVDLSKWAGQTVDLRLETAADPGIVALWTSPLLTTTGPQPRPNILIYTIDTLRADHASLYGYRRDTTPFLKKLGASGIVFEDCQAQATWTKPSIASLMTSLYSFTHGIVRDADTIPAGAATLAEQLRAAGYVTASVVSTPFVGKATGLDRGFDQLLEFPVVVREHNQQSERDTDSEALNRVLFPWLDRHRNEPFLLYAHATDPHAPYNPPPPFDAAFAKPSDNAAFRQSYNRLLDEHQYGGGVVATREIARKAGVDPERFIREAEDRYDGEILHNDRSLEVLVNKLKQLGILENTLVIVVSDHGEEFWEHGWTGHGQSVYTELSHALLLMWNPTLFKSPRRVKEPVQLIDVMPTVLDALGLKAPDLIEGQSLLPLARGEKFNRRGLVVSSRFAAANGIGLVPENATDTFAIIDGKWKFVYRNKSAKANGGIRKIELYDRAADPAEMHDVADLHGREVEQKMAALRQWIEAQNQIRDLVGHPGASKLDVQTLERMRSLGYLGGPSQ